MYSLVMLTAMTAGPDVPKDLLCPVTPSNYGSTFWSTHSFYDCCAPARYGWVTCYSKGFSDYPGGCCPSYGPVYRPSPCACGPCGAGGFGGCAPGGCGFCGYGWPVGNQPAYYTSVLGCPPCVSGPPYAYYTNCQPCCNLNFAFDSGLIGHSHGVGYSGFGGTGNFGFYGSVPMQHKPGTFDLPPFPRPEYPLPSLTPSGPVPMPPLPGADKKGAGTPPESILPAPKKDVKKEEPKKDEPKKSKTDASGPTRATVVVSVPARATVTVEGQALKSTGDERTFLSPELESGREFVYTVRAVVQISGTEEVETQQVKVTAGRTSRVSFEKLYAKVEAATRSLAEKPN